MPEPPPSLEERLRLLDEAIRDLSGRVGRLEHERSIPAALAPETAVTAGLPTKDIPSAGDFTGTLSLIGRTLVVLGGAYLLRALTESGRLPEASGMLLGLTYASAWNIAADRAAGTKRPLSGLFHGMAATVIGLPIIIEASVRFHSLSPGWAAAALVVTTALALGVSAHRRLPSLAIVASASGMVTAGILAVATGQVVPFAAALGVLSVGALWMGDALGWPWMRWTPALTTDLLLGIALYRALVVPAAEPPAAALLLLLAMGLVYGAWFGFLIGVRARRAGAFEFTQTVCLILLALLGSVVVARSQTPGLTTGIGIAAILAGLAGYGLAVVMARRPDADRINVHFFGMVALALVLISSAMMVAGATLGLWFAGAALVATAACARFREPIALMHGAVFTVLAAAASGLLSLVAGIWLTMPTSWPGYEAAAAVVLAAAIASLAVPARAAREGSPTDAIARVMLGAVIAVGIGTAVVLVVGPALAGTPPDAGILASLETAVLAGGAALLARASRVPRGAGLGRLAYPVLVLGAIKLFAEDFRYSRPSTLFLALALYGIALIAVPRLLRGSQGPGAS